MLRSKVRDDGDDRRIRFAERGAARRGPADFDLRNDASPRNPSTTTTSHRRSPYSPSKKTDRGGFSGGPPEGVRGSEAEPPPGSGAPRSCVRNEHRRVRAGRLVPLRVLALDVRVIFVVRVLEGADLQPSFANASMSCTATVVLPASCAPVTRRNRGRDFFEG